LIRVWTVRLLAAFFAGIVMDADLAKVPPTDTAGVAEAADDPHPARATVASNGMESRTVKRRMSNLVVSGGEPRQPTGIN
jgi:hypothetical protein